MNHTDTSTDTGAPGEPRSPRRAFIPVLGFVCLLWAIELADSLAGLNLTRFGVYPRHVDGLAGVLWAPLIHGSWSHLIANTAPVLVLGTALLYGYPRAARIVVPVIYLGSGFAVWLFARPAFHLGASGLTSGVLLFVFTIGVLRWDRQAIALAMVVFFLYGSMVAGVLPDDPAISWETHLSGALIGLLLAFALRRWDPPRPRRRYSWEDEEEDADPTDAESDAAIGAERAFPGGNRGDATR